MKHTIFGFSQLRATELGLKLDELLLLRYFIDFKESESMATKLFDERAYYWVNYEKFRIELPILDISRDRMYRKFKSLVDVGILLHKTEKKGGTWSYYAVGPKYFSLISDSVKITEGYGENNGTKNSSIIYSSTKDIHLNIYSSVINHLNDKAKTSFKFTTEKTQRLINARLKEGFKLNDFYRVIDNKCSSWMGTDYQIYLRPETLFGSKFESYLNQQVKENNHGSYKQNPSEAKSLHESGIGL